MDCSTQAFKLSQEADTQRRKHVGPVASYLFRLTKPSIPLFSSDILNHGPAELCRTICKADKRLGHEKGDVITFGGMTDSVS